MSIQWGLNQEPSSLDCNTQTHNTTPHSPEMAKLKWIAKRFAYKLEISNVFLIFLMGDLWTPTYFRDLRNMRLYIIYYISEHCPPPRLLGETAILIFCLFWGKRQNFPSPFWGREGNYIIVVQCLLHFYIVCLRFYILF